MFKTLYKKLTILNALVLITFLLLFSYSIVSFLSVNQSTEAKRELQMVANDIIQICEMRNSFDFYGELPISKNIQYTVWYNNIKLSNVTNLRIIENTSLFYALHEQAEQTFRVKNQSFNIIDIEGISYRLYSTYYQLSTGEGGVIQVMQNQTTNNNTLNMLFFLLIRIGLIGAIILIFISSYLAKKSLEPVRQSYEKQKQFIADASHELRTPLTVMKTSLELLSMKEDETIKKNEKWFENLVYETNAMSKLVQNLLILAQVDNKQIQLKMEDVDLSLLVTQVCERMRLITDEMKLEFGTEIDENIQINGDKNRLEQLLVILIDNAIKYTPKGGKISVGLRAAAEKVIMSVKDTGMGIDMEDKEKIFHRFYRVDKVRAREQGGAGLGLSIAQWIVKEHKGKIQIQSEVNLGSEFIIEFPGIINNTQKHIE